MIKLRVYGRYDGDGGYCYPKVGDVFASGIGHYRVVSRDSHICPGTKYLDFTVEETNEVPTYATELLCNGLTWNEWRVQTGDYGDEDAGEYRALAAWKRGTTPEEYRKQREEHRSLVREITRAWCGDS